jgi:hypothetical protein
MQLSENRVHMLPHILQLIPLLVKKMVFGRGIEDPGGQRKKQKSRG